MRSFLLGLLIARPLSLYEIHERFSHGLAHIYAASYGSIHRALKQLLAQGLIAPHPEPFPQRNRVRYVVTPEGSAAWLDWMRSPASTEDVETAALSRVFLLGLVEREADRRAVLDALRALATAQHASLARLDSATRTVEEPPSPYALATLRYGSEVSAGLVDWLDRVSALDAPTADAGARS